MANGLTSHLSRTALVPCCIHARESHNSKVKNWSGSNLQQAKPYDAIRMLPTAHLDSCSSDSQSLPRRHPFVLLDIHSDMMCRMCLFCCSLFPSRSALFIDHYSLRRSASAISALSAGPSVTEPCHDSKGP